MKKTLFLFLSLIAMTPQRTKTIDNRSVTTAIGAIAVGLGGYGCYKGYKYFFPGENKIENQEQPQGAAPVQALDPEELAKQKREEEEEKKAQLEKELTLAFRQKKQKPKSPESPKKQTTPQAIQPPLAPTKQPQNVFQSNTEKDKYSNLKELLNKDLNGHFE